MGDQLSGCVKHIGLRDRSLSAIHEIERALDMIGEPGKTDHDIAKVIVDAELGLRALVNDALGPR